MLDSTTWEEAPSNGRIWRGQRRRWLKGWLTTWLVHMRNPARLFSDLGPWRFALLQVVLGSGLLSALVYPLYLAAIAALAVAGKLPLGPSGDGPMLWWLAAATFLLGLAAPMLLAGIAVVRRGRLRLLLGLPAMPIYWLFIAWAGYEALLERIHRPFHWEKTPHGQSRRSVDAPAPPT
jgi:cellulose synthase/poly-beta-1,6-N-acetylglucosamine synthase-like glycosyltransferase